MDKTLTKADFAIGKQSSDSVTQPLGSTVGGRSTMPPVSLDAGQMTIVPQGSPPEVLIAQPGGQVSIPVRLAKATSVLPNSTEVASRPVSSSANPTASTNVALPPDTPRLDRCLALTLKLCLTDSRPCVRVPRGYSVPQVAIKPKPTATPRRHPASPCFDTYTLAIPAFYTDIVRSQKGMIPRLRPHARRRPLRRIGL